MAWYQLFFQFTGIAEATIQHNGWAWLRELARGDGDHYLDGERMEKSGEYVAGPWRYEEIAGASHWIPLDAPGQLNALLLGWLG